MANLKQNKPDIPGRFLVDRKQKNKRMEICGGCEKFIKLTHQCNVCFCFLDLKTWLKNEECPGNPKKWEKES